jgi:hypothetical protein
MGNSGCLFLAASAAAGGAATAGYVYVKGQVGYTFTATFDDTWNATLKALSELNMPIVEQDRNKNESGSILTRTKDDTPVRIEFEAEHDKEPTEGPATGVYVRAGLTGDHAISDQILAQINAHLVPNGAIPGAAGWQGAVPPPGVSAQPAARLTPMPVPTTLPPVPGAPPPTSPPPLLAPEPVRSGQ